MSDSNRETNWPPVYTTISTEEYQALLAVARVADAFDEDTFIENRDIKKSTPPYTVEFEYVQALRKALDAAKQIPSIKAEIEKRDQIPRE